MKKAFIALVCVGLLAGAANASDIRIFLGDAADAVSEGVTPEFTCDDSPVTLYIWADVLDGDKWIGISMNVDIEGCATLIETSELYDRDVALVPGLKSWNPGSDFSFVGDNYAAVAAITEQGLGAPFVDAPDIDAGARGYYLIGELTVECCDPCEAADLYLTVGPSGIARQGADPGEDDIYFGWGDDPVASDVAGVRSALPEAIVCIPEPASLMLLALAGLALRRR